MKNDFLEYYGTHSISPVRQNISDFGLHMERRRKLYRQCGIPVLAFRDAEILEVGTGGGYNTLAFFHWNVKHADLVEANPQGIRDMRRLFAEHNIPVESYSIFESMIEDYKTDKKYDIVIAESFLPYVYNQKEIINKLKTLVNEDGIIVITCIDDVCMFIEAMKRLAAVFVSSGIEEYGKKVQYLADFFRPQLCKLRGVSRSAEEWVQDQILNPAGINGMELSLAQAIEYFEDGFDILGSSPCMFTDYSWYKDLWYDYKADYKDQFARKRMSLLQANMREVILPLNVAEILTCSFKNVKKLAAEYEKTYSIGKIEKIIGVLDDAYDTISEYFDEGFVKVFLEIRDMLVCIQKSGLVEMDKYPNLFCAFGRTQQYISFVKK